MARASQARARGATVGGVGRSLAMPSSVISNWHYDAPERRLEVRFVSGKRYSYHDVPAAVAEGFADAASQGSYFNDVIRDRFAFSQAGRRRSFAE